MKHTKRRNSNRHGNPVKVFNAYVKFQLILLALGLIWLALGGMQWESGLVGAVVVGAIVWAAREWAGGWGDSSGKSAILWLVAGILTTAIASALSDGTPPKWISKLSVIGAICIGFGVGASIASIVHNIRRSGSD